MKTTIIIGAGASAEFGLPVGAELQNQISSLTKLNPTRGGLRPYSHNEHFFDVVPTAVNRPISRTDQRDALFEKANLISVGVREAPSIDNFIHNHRRDEDVVAIGKLAIAYGILNAEKSSTLFKNNQATGFPNVSASQIEKGVKRASDSWIGQLAKVISSGRDFTEFCDEIGNYCFICFNYDRCIERYFAEFVSLVYPAEDIELGRLQASLKVIRPYGSLGDYFEPHVGQSSFGLLDDGVVLKAANQIKTFTEGMDSEVVSRIGDAFDDSDTVFFLGYGFIRNNDDFLFKKAPFQISRVMGTAFGVSAEKKEFLMEKIKRNLLQKQTPYDGLVQHGTPKLHDETCADFVFRYSFIFE